LHCWDLNGNGIEDEDEDINEDNEWNTDDCKSPAGEDGEDGEDGATGATGAAGLSCWDLNGDGVEDPSEDINGDEVWDTIDCQIDVSALEQRLEVLEEYIAALQHCLSVDMDSDAAVFSGCNVYVQSGSGSTNDDEDGTLGGEGGGALTGLGNLIVGYDEDDGASVKDGSHNLVVGSYHSYTSYGGFVVGFENTVSAPGAAVSGGYMNVARNDYASVSGGYHNEASNQGSSVVGGTYNTASGNQSTVTGGTWNTAGGHLSVVSGGENNSINSTTDGMYSVISGGGFNDITVGQHAFIGGGKFNAADGDYSAILGDYGISLTGEYDIYPD